MLRLLLIFIKASLQDFKPKSGARAFVHQNLLDFVQQQLFNQVKQLILNLNIPLNPPSINLKQREEVVQIAGGRMKLISLNMDLISILPNNQIYLEMSNMELEAFLVLQMFVGVRALQFAMKARVVSNKARTNIDFDQQFPGYFKPLIKFENFQVDFD